ncbi:unnamed protein product, partial [Rotaria sp. Silwood1]
SDKVPVTVTKKVPKFVKDLKANKTPLTEGEQLILECELDMAPTSVQLQINGEKVPDDRVKTEVKDKKLKFTLDNVKLDESGDYTVKVNDEVESKPVAIKVNADVPKFVKNLTINKKQFDIGETLNFECTLNKPFNEIVWFKDSQPIEQDEHVQFVQDGPKLKLIIKDAQPKDHTGTYSVQVKNVESDKVPVTVTKKVPKFVKDLKANKTPLTEGEQLILECELDMAPSKVELILNGEIVPNDRIKPEIKDKKIKFTLDNIQLNESGDFTVKVNDEVESQPVLIKVNADIPKFIKNLSINKKKFDIGETLNFECTLNKPFNQIVWLKDNEPIEEDAHIQFFVDGPKLKMTIKDAQPSDHTGTYSVRVKDVESDRIPVVVQEKPLTFVKDLKATKPTLDENETLELSCQLSRPLKPDETIQWYRNEIQIPIVQEYPNEQINLQIPNVDTTISGDYYLEISSPYEKKPLRSATIKITIKQEEIKFLKPLRALKNPLNEDETLILECELDKPTYKSVKFSFNDKPLNEDEDDRIKISQTGNKWQIQITHVKQETDEGDYTVTINDKLTSPKVKVTIIKPLTFIQDLTVSNSEPIVDETITFQCELSRPLPTGDSKDLSLTLNGKPLSNEQTRRLKVDVSSTSPKIVLTLSNVKLTIDQGNYQLKILHPQELQSQTVNVKILPKPIEVIQPLQSDKENIFEEDTLVLSTKLKNVPENPTIVWLKDNQPISIDNKRIRSIPSRDGQQFKLSIENVKLNQSGTYALQINDDIITQCDITIKSIPLKTVVPLKVLGTPIIGGNVELQIELNRPNVPFIWLKDNIPLENQPSPTKDQTKYRLKLSDLKLDDSGVYSISFNDGELKESVNLTVALPPFEFIEQLKCIPSDDIEEDSNVIMQCVLNRPIDDENIPVTLLKNNKPLSAADNARVKIERDGPTLKIHLNNVKSDDAGVYKVTVDKTKDTSTRLKVHDKPLSIIEQLHLVDAKDDNNTVSENLPFELFIRYNKPVKNVVLNRDNKRVPIDKHTQIIYEDNSSSVRIRVDAAQPDDKGKYETIVKDSTVTNKDGLRSQSVTIIVKPLPVLFTSDIQVSAPNRNNIPEKTELTLTTTINQEKGKIKWFLNNKEIKEDQNHKIIVKNLQRQLIIKSTLIADSGIYSAKSDDDERTIELTITEEIRFTKELTPSNINTVEGKEKELVFECETSKPTTVQWYHDQQKLSPNELKKNYQIESLKNNTLHRLRILQPVSADSGLYRCVLPTNIETNSQCIIEPAGVDFLQHLTTPVHVEYMKSALLECELSKRPQNVVWKDKNGKIIEDSDKYEIMNNGKLQGLIINDCDENDNGQYTITIDNNKSSTAEVIVEPHEEKVRSPSPKLETQEPIKAGFRKLLPNKLNTNEDNDFILECEVNNPKQITDWYLDDDLIDENTPRFEIINNGPIRQLKVHKAELNDTGKYTCKDRQSGETTNSDVDVAKAPIRIIKGLPETLIVPQGEQLKLDVELSHPNIPGCRFVKDDTNTPIRKDKRTRITADGTHYTLIIDNVLPVGDSGTYEFIGLNDTLRSACKVTVKPLPSKITQPLKDVTLQENQNLSLEARVDNEHAPVTWFINGKEIPPGGDAPHITIMSKGRRHTLVVQKVNAKQDAGQYEIRTPDDASSCQVTIEEAGTPPADFTKKLQNLESEEFQTIELKCETNRDNLPVEWFKDSKLIEPNEHYKFENNGKIHSLIINNVLINDQGSYTCQIKSNGKTTTATLKVKEKPADFAHKIEPIDAITGDTVSFECELNKPNMKVKWLKDNKPLTMNDRIQSSIDSENPHIHILTLKTLEIKDAATYTCVIDQPVSKKCSAPLTVKSITVKLIEPLKDVSLIENENLVLKFDVSHELKQIPVIWKLDNKPIKADDDRIQIEQDGKSYFLTIKKIQLNEQGSYTAEIPTHKIQTSSQVKVKPEEIKILKDLHIVPNDEQPENLILEIQLNKPLPTDIILLKDGVKPTRKIPVENLNNGTYRFLLENVTPDDSGLYEIPLGPDLKSSLQVNIQPKQKEDLDFTIPLKDKIEINENEPIHLEAKLNRQPDSPNDIVWLRNGKPIPSTITTAINKDLTITLDIPKGNIENDTGKYTLKLPNGKQCSTQVNILRKPTKKDKNEILQPLHIILDENQTELKLNEKVTLRCKTSLPVKNVEWYKGARKVSTRRADILSTENSTQHDLVLSKLEIDDLGQYRIVLDSDLESSIDLNISQELSPIRCEGEPIEGQTITLICNATLPPKQIQWSPIVDRKRYDQQDLSLKIKNLNIEQDSKVFTITVDGQKQSYELVIKPIPIKFQGTIELNPKLPKEDDNVTCTVTLNKPLKDQVLDWYLNDQLIIPNDRFVISSDGLRSILTIKKIRPQDSGLLECHIPFSDEKLSTELKVKEKPLSILKPLTSDKDKPMEGDDVTLSCQFSRKPKTIEVYKDGKPIDAEQKLNDVDATFKINLPKTKPNDKGKYTVTADGVETSYTLRLTPNPIKFVKQLKWDKESPYEGETVQATFTLSRIPDKPMQWFKGKFIFKQNKEYSINTYMKYVLITNRFVVNSRSSSQ